MYEYGYAARKRKIIQKRTQQNMRFVLRASNTMNNPFLHFQLAVWPVRCGIGDTFSGWSVPEAGKRIAQRCKPQSLCGELFKRRV